MKSVEVFGIRLDDLSEEKLDELLLRWLNTGGQRKIVTPNPEIVLEAKKSDAFRRSLNSADLSLPDGVGLKYAVMAMSGIHVRRHTGTDTVVRLVRIAAEQGRKVLFFGGEIPEVAQKAATVLKKRYPHLQITGLDPGSVKTLKSGEVQCSEWAIAAIQEFEPDILAVALGQKKQEFFIDQYFSALPSVNIAIGIGGAFDMISGEIPRSSAWMQKTGLEWLWRLYLKPSRVRRIARASVVFPLVVAWGTLKKRRFWRACRDVFPLVFKELTGKERKL